MCVACVVLRYWRSQFRSAGRQLGIQVSTSKFVIVTGGYEVSWAPRFDTRVQAELWLAQDHEWEERTEVEFEGYSARTNCGECGKFAECDMFDDVWFCEACQVRFTDPEQAFLFCQVCGKADWVAENREFGYWSCEGCL